MDNPTFSILLPAKGRPELVPDALVSVLEQSFEDFEVIVSNNGGDTAVRDALVDLCCDQRVRYVEQQRVLPMPEHWEHLSRLARGRYQIVVPDRSVMKQNALSKIEQLHASGGEDAEIISWSWDLFHSKAGMLESVVRHTMSSVVLGSDAVAIDSLRISNSFPMALPRGLNSSVASSLIEELRIRIGAAFTTINPDFSFAYACLLMRKRLTHLSQPLCISQGLSVSNGGNAYKTDACGYIETLGLDEPIRFSPIKAAFVENIIAEDFFAACHAFGRPDLRAKMEIADLYLKCFAELDVKRNARILAPERIAELTAELEQALEREMDSVRVRVNEAKSARRTYAGFVRSALRRVLGDGVDHLRPLVLRWNGGRRFSSALEAAGHSGQ